MISIIKIITEGIIHFLGVMSKKYGPITLLYFFAILMYHTLQLSRVSQGFELLSRVVHLSRVF